MKLLLVCFLLYSLIFSLFDQQNNDWNLSIPSFDEQVKTAIEAITQSVKELRSTVRDLAGRVEETSNNFRINQRKLNEVTRELKDKMDSMNENVNNIQDRMDRDIEENRNTINGLQTNFEELTDRVDNGNRNMEERIRKHMEEKIGPNILSIAVLHPQILLLGDGKIESRSNIFLLDYATQIWKKLPIKMSDILSDGSVVVNDELYIIGYNYKARTMALQRLNKQMEWEERADMNEARWGIRNSHVVYNNCIWVFGGNRSWDDNLNTVEKYDPNTNRWEMKPEMMRKRNKAAAAVLKDKIYVCGGFDGTILDSVEVFDTTSEVWTDFCTMPEPRINLCVVAEGTSIILIGGNHYNRREIRMTGREQKTVWKMDVEDEQKKWTYLPPLNQARSLFSAVKIEGGHILVTGGCTWKSPQDRIDLRLKSVEIFDGEKWNEFSNLPEERYQPNTCVTPPMIDSFKKFLN